MRISDWSSDVCSSDLDPPREERRTATYRDQKIGRERRNLYFCLIRLARRTCLHPRVWIFSNAASRYAIRIPPRVGGSACISLNEKHYEYDRTTKCTIQIGRAHVELQSLMRISYAVFCLKKNTTK